MPTPHVKKCTRCGSPVTPLGTCCRADCSSNRPTNRPRSLKPVRRCITVEPETHAAICPDCRKRVTSGFKFCPHCQAPLSPADATVYSLVDRGRLRPLLVPKIEERPASSSAPPPAQSGTYSLFEEEDADDVPTGTGRK
ncbi:hypothetical protein HZC53_05120 [Candidatus Uhrbacteria bacterium]|nr:hypothetical protein [Candidatus Uhrbacteria bacterium]